MFHFHKMYICILHMLLLVETPNLLCTRQMSLLGETSNLLCTWQMTLLDETSDLLCTWQMSLLGETSNLLCTWQMTLLDETSDLLCTIFLNVFTTILKVYYTLLVISKFSFFIFPIYIVSKLQNLPIPCCIINGLIYFLNL